jgi:hypothetical protein
MAHQADLSDPSTWDPELDAVKAAPKHHKVIFENDNLRVLEVTLEPNEEEPVHHHRWPSVFVLDQIKPPVVDITPDGERLPPNRDVIAALEGWMTRCGGNDFPRAPSVLLAGCRGTPGSA